MKAWLLLPLCFVTCLAAYADDDDDVVLPGLNPVVHLGEWEDGPLLLVDSARRSWLGLETHKLTEAAHQPLYNAVAVVVSVASLQQQWEQLHSAILAVEGTRAKLALASDMHDRLRSLSRAGDSGVAIAKMQQAEAERSDSERGLGAAKLRFQSLYAGIMREFGPGVAAALVVSQMPGWMQGLLAGDSALLKVSMGLGQWLHNADLVRFELPDGSLEEAVVFAPDTGVSPLGGQGWLALAKLPLPEGLRLTAWVLQTAKTIAGVSLPKSSVLWFGGVSWVYLETEPDSFARVRVDLNDATDTGSAWFMPDGFETGTVVVTRGAQLLLSEEKHGLIPDEDDRP